MTIEDVLTMRAGLDYPDLSDPTLAALTQSENWISFLLDRPMAAQPGSTFSYSTGATHLLSGVLAKSTGETPRVFANENLFGPLGIAPVSTDQWAADPQGLSLGGEGLLLTPRDMAKLGYLYLKGGIWDGRQSSRRPGSSKSTRLQTMKDDGYGEGYLWSLDTRQGSFMALGAGGQQIYVDPSKQLVVVMTAGLAPGQNRDFAPLKALFDDYVLPAVKSDKPLPPDTSAIAELKARIGRAISPLEPVPSLPALATQVSGRTYQMADNPAGWHTVQFIFGEGEPQASAVIDGVALDPPIALDNVCRVGQASGGSQRCLRGAWQSDGTFVIHEVDLGQLSEMIFSVRFEGNDVSITATESLSGSQMHLEGAAQASVSQTATARGLL